MNPVEIKLIGTEYVGYYFGKEITKQKSVVKAAEKIFKYLKSQG